MELPVDSIAGNGLHLIQIHEYISALAKLKYIHVSELMLIIYREGNGVHTDTFGYMAIFSFDKARI